MFFSQQKKMLLSLIKSMIIILIFLVPSCFHDLVHRRTFALKSHLVYFGSGLFSVLTLYKNNAGFLCVMHNKIFLTFFCPHVCVCAALSNSLRPHGLLPTRLLCPRDSPGKNIGLGCHFLLQGSSQSRGRTHISCISCIGRWILDCWCHLRGTDYQVVWVQKERQLVATDGGHVES